MSKRQNVTYSGKNITLDNIGEIREIVGSLLQSGQSDSQHERLMRAKEEKLMARRKVLDERLKRRLAEDRTEQEEQQKPQSLDDFIKERELWQKWQQEKKAKDQAMKKEPTPPPPPKDSSPVPGDPEPAESVVFESSNDSPPPRDPSPPELEHNLIDDIGYSGVYPPIPLTLATCDLVEVTEEVDLYQFPQHMVETCRWRTDEFRSVESESFIATDNKAELEVSLTSGVAESRLAVEKCVRVKPRMKHESARRLRATTEEVVEVQFEMAQPQQKEAVPCTRRLDMVTALSETVRVMSSSTVVIGVHLCMRARQEKCHRVVQLCNLIKCAKRILHEITVEASFNIRDRHRGRCTASTTMALRQRLVRRHATHKTVACENSIKAPAEPRPIAPARQGRPVLRRQAPITSMAEMQRRR